MSTPLLGRRPAGRRRRVAALFAAAVTVFSSAAPGALASPTPTPPSSSSSPAESSGVTLAVPPGTEGNDDQAIDKGVQEFLDVPTGEQVIRAWRGFQKRDPKKNLRPPANTSVEWFGFDWMRRDDSGLPDWLRDNTDFFFQQIEDAIKNSDFNDNYRVEPKVVASWKTDLYDHLGVPRDGLLFQVAAGSSTADGMHSEENSRNWMESAIRLAISRTSSSPVGSNKLKMLAEQITRKSSLELAGLRSPCLNKCDEKTQNVPRRMAAVYYGKERSADAKRANAVLKVFLPKADAELSRRDSGLRQKAVKQANGNVDLKDPCSSSGGVGGLDTGGRGRGGPVPAIAALPMAAPCSSPEGGLAKALGSSDLGGVDFSTLEMRYLSDSSGGVQYSFSARPATPGLQPDADSGLDALTKSTADLRTWLVLDPSKFWVNLNPTQPDKIVDPQLGQTNAGRALLEADFAMKRTASKLLDPGTSLGARYWRAFGKSGSSCYTSRFWIVPGDVQVREAGSSLYILKATLAVKTQAMHIDGLAHPCHSSPASDARNERLEKAMVVPKVAEAVNNAPEYAPIRRAFLARVLAQWVRKRHQEGHPTSFDDLIDSGDLGPAKLQGGWRPKQVFDSYVRSIQDGEFTYHQTLGNGSIREIKLGGVDFSKLDSTLISAAQMDQQHPRLAQAVRASGDRPAAAPDGTIWLGESNPAPDPGALGRASNAMRSLVSSRTTIAIVLVVALLVATFGIRAGTGRRRPQP